MTALIVEITRWADDHQPGWVECSLLDCMGTTHRFVEKLPIVTLEHLTAASRYPKPGRIDCEVIRRWEDPEGRLLAKVSTARPSDVESIDGQTEFVVLESQLDH